MATLNIRISQEAKDNLKEIAKYDDRSITKELIHLIEERYKVITNE